jgi:hypothetical protein
MRIKERISPRAKDYRLDGQFCLKVGVFDPLFINTFFLSIKWLTTPDLRQT